MRSRRREESFRQSLTPTDMPATQPASFVPTWAYSDPQVRPLNERSTRRLVLTRADMPQSVQDLHEVASDDESEGHDESIPVFDPDTDDDTDSVIDAFQRDLEGADTLIDSLGSDVQVGVEREAAAHNQPQ